MPSQFNRAVSGEELRGNPWEEGPPPQSRGPRGAWALPPGPRRIRIGREPVKRKKKVNSAIPQVLSELLKSKAAESFLLKT